LFEESRLRFSHLLRLPRIGSLSLRDIPDVPKFTHPSLPRLKQLFMTEAQDISASMLEGILKACPVLEDLDLTWMPAIHTSGP
jgi:hypothetical protein